MHTAINAAGSFISGSEHFGYRDALAEVIAELGQTADTRHDHPECRGSRIASSKASDPPRARSAARGSSER